MYIEQIQKTTKNTFENVVYDKTDNNTKQVVGKVQVEKPLETLFEGADPNIYKETKEMSDDIKKQFSEIKEDFCFLSTGHWLAGNLGEDRKDIGMLLKVFLEGFKNRENTPALILKTSGATFSVMDREDIIKKINTIRNDIRADKLPNVYLLHGDLSDEEMNQMYNHPKVKSISYPGHKSHPRRSRGPRNLIRKLQPGKAGQETRLRPGSGTRSLWRRRF